MDAMALLRVTGLCAGNSPAIGEFPVQIAGNAENVSIWWRHHVIISLWGFVLMSFMTDTYHAHTVMERHLNWYGLNSSIARF